MFLQGFIKCSDKAVALCSFACGYVQLKLVILHHQYFRMTVVNLIIRQNIQRNCKTDVASYEQVGRSSLTSAVCSAPPQSGDAPVGGNGAVASDLLSAPPNSSDFVTHESQRIIKKMPTRRNVTTVTETSFTVAPQALSLNEALSDGAFTL